MTTIKPIVGFAGMTHLGINSAVATAERGFQVLCFDTNTALIAELATQQLPITEPKLPELFSKNFADLKFSHMAAELQACDVVYISADVPTNDLGQSDLSPIQDLIKIVAEHLSETAILVILCQVPPGFTRKLSFPKARVYYQVETLVFGSAMDRALYPERFIIGCEQATRSIPEQYHQVLQAFACPILAMRYESAELAKIAINCCLVSAVTVANTLSELCENIGADWSEIVPALKLDKRIGQHAYLSPGLGIAGGNLERDLKTVLELSAEQGSETGVVSAWIQNSHYRRDWVLKILKREVLSRIAKPVIGVLGLAYKENTHSTKNSPALALLEWLQSFTVKIYDPEVPSDVVPWAEGLTQAAAAFDEVDVLIVMTPWPEFKNLDIKKLVCFMKNRFIIDPYRVFNSSDLESAAAQYFTLGVGEPC